MGTVANVGHRFLKAWVGNLEWWIEGVCGWKPLLVGVLHDTRGASGVLVLKEGPPVQLLLLHLLLLLL